jgi:hypothetical protein
MSQTFGNHFAPKPLLKTAPVFAEPQRRVVNAISTPTEKPTYAKVFRWQLPEGQMMPSTVELVGSFTQWQRVPMIQQEGTLNAWQVTIHKVESHRTHHYMILVDGQPVQDKTADGLAIPHCPQEKQYQLMTARGPRLFMLFAQAK